MKVSIVIPSYKHPELANQILMDIYQNCPTVDEVVMVDDASHDEKTFETYQFWKRVDSFPLKLFPLPENLGFLKASNYGLKQATGDIVALISSDVRIKKDLAKISKEIIATSFDKILLGGRLLDFDTGWNQFNGKIYPYVEGWALIANKRTWEELGYFDERFAPFDAEDLDLSTTAISKGCELKTFAPWHGEVLEHMVAKTIGYNPEREEITKRNIKKFEEKWLNVASP